MDGCVFCKILDRQLPGSFVFQSELVSAFLDIHPMNPGHVLIVPNKHFSRFGEIDKEIAGKMFEVAQVILKAIQASSVRCEGANIFLSDGEVAGQEVGHSHLHVVPRFKGDGQRPGFAHGKSHDLSREDLDQLALSISAQIG